MGKRFALGAGAGLAAMLIAAPAGQASVTIGSSLSTAGNSATVVCAASMNCTMSPSAIPGRTVTSPVNGIVVRWSLQMLGGSFARFRVLRPLGNSALFLSSGRTENPPGGLSTFTTPQPISAGDRIGVDDNGGYMRAQTGVTGAKYDSWETPADGAAATPAFSPSNTELLLNAEIEPTNTFTVGTPVLDKKKGNATVDVGLPNTGTVGAVASRVKLARTAKSPQRKGKRKRPRSKPLITPFTVTSVGAGTATLRLNSSKPVQRALRARGRANGLVSITYTPDFGSPSTQTLTVSLKLKSQPS